MNIILIGYRACGKSSVGKILAQKLNYTFVDCDFLISERLKSSISSYVALNGWHKFRIMETEILAEILQYDNQVIATGGGIVVSHEACKLLKQQPYTVWLAASCENIARRIKADESSHSMRPPLGNFKNLTNEVRFTLTERSPLYTDCANIIINGDLLTPEQITNEIIQVWHLTPTEF